MLHGDAAVIVNGKFAQFGGRMMVQVSDMLLAQFVENFRQAAHALPPLRRATPAAEAAPTAPALAPAADNGACPPQPRAAAPAQGREGNQRPGHRLDR